MRATRRQTRLTGAPELSYKAKLAAESPLLRSKTRRRLKKGRDHLVMLLFADALTAGAKNQRREPSDF